MSSSVATSTNRPDSDPRHQGMDVAVLGLSHKLAPVAVRERLAFARSDIGEALARLREVAAEGAILSTCNRTEIYAAIDDPATARETLLQFVSEQRRAPRAAFEPYIFFHHGEAAIRHLFAVAAGLDSMVLGEAQILGQVRQTLETAIETDAAGSLLAALLRQAVVAGKRARAETGIGRSAASVSAVAVGLAQHAFGRLDDRTVLVLGAGKMSELTAKILADQGVARMLVVSRTLDKAKELAHTFGGQALDFADLETAVAQADIIICSTNAPHYVVRPAMVEAAMRQRGGRRQLLVDIAVPRDVDPRVGAIEGVVLRDIDDLEATVRTNLQEREREATRVWTIVDQETTEFAARLRARRAIPTIAALRSQAEAIRRAELDRAFRRLNGLSEDQRAVVEATTWAIVNKLLHAPTVQLKRCALSTRDDGVIATARQLFGLDSLDGSSAIHHPREVAGHL